MITMEPAAAKEQSGQGASLSPDPATKMAITHDTPKTSAPLSRPRIPEADQAVGVRTRTHLVESVEKQPNGCGTLVRLARLLKLNAERAEQERPAGLAAATSTPSKPKRPQGKKSADASAQGDLIRPPQRDLWA